MIYVKIPFAFIILSIEVKSNNIVFAVVCTSYVRFICETFRLILKQEIKYLQF